MFSPKKTKLILVHSLNLVYNNLNVDWSNVLEICQPILVFTYNEEFFYFKGFFQEVINHNIDMKNVNY